jgi:transposase InsO family protein
LGYNILSVSQLLDEGFEVRFKMGCSRVLDSRGDAARVCLVGGKWYVLVIVDDYSRYAWVFFLADKGKTFGFVRDLFLRLKNERNGDVVQAICSDNGSEFKNSRFETFL